jgi:hypothetical protein
LENPDRRPDGANSLTDMLQDNHPFGQIKTAITEEKLEITTRCAYMKQNIHLASFA